MLASLVRNPSRILQITTVAILSGKGVRILQTQSSPALRSKLKSIRQLLTTAKVLPQMSTSLPGPPVNGPKMPKQ